MSNKDAGSKGKANRSEKALINIGTSLRKEIGKGDGVLKCHL